MDEFDYEDAILQMQEDRDPDVQQVLSEDEKENLRIKYMEVHHENRT